MRVDLLVTGRTEAEGMAEALQNLFPRHEFQCLLERPRDGVPYSGFTSARLPGRSSSAPSAVKKIVEAATASLVPERRRGDPSDFLFILDDLELVNADQPTVVADVFARELRRHLDQLEGRLNPSRVQCIRDAFLTKTSLHFVTPMVEAWFFTDGAALSACGVAQSSTVEWYDSRDPEDFETGDPAYLAATESDCPEWVSRGRNRKCRPKWLGSHNRARHPKGYVQWLCREGTDKSCTSYREATGGRALAGLDWARVLERPDGHITYLRSLVADLASALDEPPETGPVTHQLAALTDPFAVRPNPVLRNL